MTWAELRAVTEGAAPLDVPKAEESHGRGEEQTTGLQDLRCRQLIVISESDFFFLCFTPLQRKLGGHEPNPHDATATAMGL